MSRWLRIAGIGCGGLAILFVVFFLGVVLGGVGSDSPASSPDSQPAKSPELATTEEPGQEPLTLSSTGSQVTDPIRLSAGLAIFETSHQGEGNFIVDLISEDGRNVDLVANEVGDSESSQGIRVPSAGKYRLNIDADGPWTIRVR